MRSASARWILILWGALAGCAAAPLAEPEYAGPALPYRMLVAAPEVVFDPEEWNGDPTLRYSVAADTSTLQAAFREGFDWEGLFVDVGLLPSLTGEDPLGRAAEEGADLLLETRVMKRVATYVGTNGLYVPNLVLWSIAWPPTWWIKDETYSLEVQVEVDLRSVRSGLSIYQGVHRVEVEEDLDDFERGWQLLGIFRVPGSLGPSNWRKVDRALAPAAETSLARKIADEAGRKIGASTGSPGFRHALAGRFALIVGISHAEDIRIQDLRFAEADARGFREHLIARTGIPAHNTRLLLNGQADLSGIRSSMEELVARGAGKNDEILVYFAGYGAWEEGRAYLVPYDADPERLGETALPLDQLARLSTGGEGPRVTLILDAPFLSRFRGRAAAGETTVTFEDVLGEFLAPPGNQVLTASRIGEGCLEFEHLGHGLFTYYLLEALEGRGDRDRDGEVRWEEAHAYAGGRVSEHARLEGGVQHPGLYLGRASLRTEAEEEDQ